MARHTKVVTIAADGRDKGKQFLVTEMAADAAERWAWRFSFALLRAGADVPEGTIEAGMAGLQKALPRLAVYGLRSMAGLRFEDVEPLLADMMACVQFKAPGADLLFPVTGTGATQIEEVSTLLVLRYEVLQLHLGFSLADALSKSKEPSSAAP